MDILFAGISFSPLCEIKMCFESQVFLGDVHRILFFNVPDFISGLIVMKHLEKKLYGELELMLG